MSSRSIAGWPAEALDATEPMKVVHCSRCGGFIQSDEMRYLVSLHVTLDRDGLGESSVTETSERLEAVRLDGESILERVACEKAFILCGPCRDLFLHNPLGVIAEPSQPLDRGFLQ